MKDLEKIIDEKIHRLALTGDSGFLEGYTFIFKEVVKEYVNSLLDEVVIKAQIKVEDSKGNSYTTGSDRFSNVTVSIDENSILSIINETEMK